MLEQNLQQQLNHWQENHLWRNCWSRETLFSNYPIINGKKFLSFCSNDYLGLANHALLIQTVKNTIHKYGIGSSASPVLGGYSDLHHALESEIAAFTGFDDCILFSSGFMANFACISSLTNKNSFLFLDKLCHASLIEAARSTEKNFLRYRHNDINHLEKLLLQQQTENNFIISDGVFSADGDIAPADQLLALGKKFSSHLILDDSHGLGILGQYGKGCVEKFALNKPDNLILTGSFGKACATAGGFIAGNSDIIKFLKQKARPFLYSTAQPALLAAATRASLQIIQHETWRREKLHELICYFNQCSKQLDLDFSDSETPIKILKIGFAKEALALQKKLMEENIFVGLMRSPTVPINSARLRITLTASHEKSEIDFLLESLQCLLL